MANSIALAKNYADLLDEVYKNAAVTSVLDSDAATVRQGNNVNEIVIPKLSMDGLGDYSRNGGYTDGDVTLTYETVQFNYDRGRKFTVDYLDNEESAEVAFGRLGAEFIRTKVAPEGDAFTFATICGISGITTVSAQTLTTGADVMAAIQTAVTAFDEDEVPQEQRILFITPTHYNEILALDTYKSKEILAGLTVVKVPQSRFYTAIDLKDGKSSGEEFGGFAKAASGADINFMLVHKPAVIKFDKHIANNIITPEANQSSDGYMQKYRKYGLVDVYENKVAGIYVNCK